MFNYLIKIEYDGTNFAGWQSQKNSDTIQDNIELALKKTLRLKKKYELLEQEELIKECMQNHNLLILKLIKKFLKK